MKASLQLRFARCADGTRLACGSDGEGATLLRSAIWLSHLEHDWDSPVWGHVMRALTRRRRLLRYDERGCGLSDRAVDDLSFPRWVEGLEAVADAFGGERFALLGISAGAATAIAYAARHPERVSHLVLHGSFARGRIARAETPRQREEAETLARLAELGWGQADAAFRQFFTSQFIPGGTPEQQRWLNELERIATAPENAAHFMRETGLIDVRELLPRVRCPTLVLHCRHDVRVPFEEGRRVAGGIPDAQFVPIDSRNHLPLEHESGWRDWIAAVDAFLPVQAEPGAAFAALTQRQRELLEQIAQGHDNHRIAAALGLSDKTVRNHVSAIFAKLGVATRAQAIVAAREAGFGRTQG